MERLTLAKMTEHLTSKQLINEEQCQQILSSQKPQSATPWYIYALITIAAWFSTLFFLIFFFIGISGNPEQTAFMMGVFLCVGAVFLNNSQGQDSIFWSQVSLALNVAGQALMIIGFTINSRQFEVIGLAFFTIVLQLIMSFFYRHPIQIFAAPILISFALFAILSDMEGKSLNYIDGPQSIHIVIAMLVAATGHLWYRESSFVKYHFFPYLVFGITCSLLAMLSTSVITTQLSMWWISGILLTVALLVLEKELLGDAITTNMGMSIVITSLLFCLITLNSPGLIAAIFTLTLGFYRNNKLLMLISFVFLAGFLFFFYYNLEMTLLNKSLILMGSGTLLIVFSTITNRFKLEVKDA